MGQIRLLLTFEHASEETAAAQFEKMLANAERARKEPGCIQYEPFRSLEFPLHTAMLELWASREAFDAHWQLCLQAVPGGLPPRSPTVKATFEIYEKQEYVVHQDVWKPVEMDKRTASIMFP